MPHISSTEEAATAGTGTLNAADGRIYEFSQPMRKVIISNDGADDLFVHLRGSVCNKADSEWSAKVEADGGTFTFTDEKDPITQVCCYSATALTYGTDFVIKGTPWWE